MSYQVLARKWRPQNLEQVLGQVHVVRALRNGLELGRIHHAYLFAGTRGVGKTTLARIFAKCLNCETGVTAKPCGECSACRQISQGQFVDLVEIDAASRTGVDDMRELLNDVNYVPGTGRFKVYLIDEVHMLSISSFNALLKTLEEPPEHVKFFFATTNPDKLPVTILSRCLKFNLTRLLPDEIESYLESMLEAESIAYDGSALRQIALAAEGSVRDSLSLLDQAIAYGNGSLKMQEVQSMLGLVGHGEVLGLLRGIVDDDASGVIDLVDVMYSRAVDFSGVLSHLIELLHEIALRQAVPDAGASAWFDVDEVKRLAADLTPEDTQLFYQIALNGKSDLPLLPDARSAFRMTMLRMLSFRPAEDIPSTGKVPAGASQVSAEKVPDAPLPSSSPVAQAQKQEPAPTTSLPSGSPVAQAQKQEPVPTTSLPSGSPVAQAQKQEPAPTTSLPSGSPVAQAQKQEPAPTTSTTSLPSGSPVAQAQKQEPAPTTSLPSGSPVAQTQKQEPAPTTSLPSGSPVAQAQKQEPAPITSLPSGSPVAQAQKQEPAPTTSLPSGSPVAQAQKQEPAPTTSEAPDSAMKLSDFATSEGWKKLIDRLQLGGAEKEICLNSMFSVQSEDEVTLAVDDHLGGVRTPANEETIQNAISWIANRDVNINFTSSSRDDETPQRQKEKARHHRLHDAEQTIDNNAVVQSLKDSFDAKIVEGKTKPLNDAD